MDLKKFMDCTVLMLALINPVSKMFVIATLAKDHPKRDINRLIWHSSLVAGIILLLFAVSGNFILREMFHVDIHSFMIAGGIVLSFRGYDALNRGVFFDMKQTNLLHELSIVPVASPMIAGPATITAVVSLHPSYGLIVIVAGSMCAVLLNMLSMFLFEILGKYLMRFNLMGALIRITGLFVMTMGIQMVLSGIHEALPHIR